MRHRLVGRSVLLAVTTGAFTCDLPVEPLPITWTGAVAWTDGLAPDPVPGAVHLSVAFARLGARPAGSGRVKNVHSQRTFDFRFTGTNQDSTLTLDIVAPGFGDFTLIGAFVGARLLVGRVEGPGFRGSPVTLQRVGPG